MSKIRLSAAMISGKGRVRSNNEDACYFNGQYAALTDMDRELSRADSFCSDQALFAVCDGMGGHENGEMASYTAVSRLPELQRELLSEDFPAALNQWVVQTNAAVSRAAKDGGCTLALLYFYTSQVFVAHIGDSRIYRYYNGKLSRMTKDHSKVQILLDAGVLTEKEAETYPQRHVITRALGMREEEHGRCLPTIREAVLMDAPDRYMICSDGVTDMLSDGRIGELLSREETAGKCAEAVYRAALDAGGEDNTTVIIIDTEGICRTPDRQAGGF